MKKIIFALFAFILIAIEGHSQKIIFIDNITYYITSEDKKEVTVYSYTGSGNVSIPSQIKDEGTVYTVVSIYSNAFSMSEVKKVTLPQTIRAIGDKAFNGCKNLSDINLPSNLETLGSDAFIACSGLTKMFLPKSLKKIGTSPFYGCTGIKNIDVDKENPIYTSIDGVLFSKNGEYLISFPPGRTGTYTTPASTIAMEVYSFRGAAITKVVLNNSITQLLHATFHECKNLTEVILPENLSIIWSDVFYNCTNLTDINLPESLECIYSSAFKGCASLKSIKIPSKLKSLPASLFEECTSLSDISLPEGIQEFGMNLFENCTSLKSITMPETLTKIESGIFKGCSSLEDVKLPSAITSIPHEMFRKCSSLAHIEIPVQVDTIGPDAFSQCKALRSIKLPENMHSLGTGAFMECTALEDINIPHNLTIIDNYLFNDCTNLKTVELHDSITYIGESAFSGCTKLKIDKFPEQLAIIGYSAFEGCSEISEIVIHNGVKSIGGRAFFECPLTQITSLTPKPLGEFYNIFGNASIDLLIIPYAYKNSYLYSSWAGYCRYIGTVGISDLSLGQSEVTIEKGHNLVLTPGYKLGKYISVAAKEWTTSDPMVAMVDNEGMVTAVGEGSATITLSLTDNFGAIYNATCAVAVSDNSGIENVSPDIDAPAEYFNLNGLRIHPDNLTPGLYIKRQGNKSEKVIVK